MVSGPNSAVVDLGTEFGVNIGLDGKSRGKVFKGEVEAAVFGTSGEMRRSQIVQEESEAFEIDPETGLIGPFTGPEDFVATSDPDPTPLILSPGYRDSILESRPRCYWRFETSAGDEIPNEVPGRPPLLVDGPDPDRGGIDRQPLRLFGPGQNDQYLRMDEPWKPEWSSGFAIEFWFQSETIGHAALVGLVAPKDTVNHLSLVELTSSNRRTLFRPASVRSLYRWPPGRDGGENVFSNDVYVPYRWHHVVSQLAGDRMELYLDGVLQSSQPIGRHGSESCQFLLGRLSTLTEGSTKIPHTGYRRAFVGLIDEVALYDRPLRAEEIQAHLRLATPAIRPD